MPITCEELYEALVDYYKSNTSKPATTTTSDVTATTKAVGKSNARGQLCYAKAQRDRRDRTIYVVKLKRVDKNEKIWTDIVYVSENKLTDYDFVKVGSKYVHEMYLNDEEDI